MRPEILVRRERRRRWSAEDKLQIVHEAFAPGALVARRRDVSRSQIYQWRTSLREGRLDGSGRAHEAVLAHSEKDAEADAWGR